MREDLIQQVELKEGKRKDVLKKLGISNSTFINGARHIMKMDCLDLRKEELDRNVSGTSLQINREKGF